MIDVPPANQSPPTPEPILRPEARVVRTDRSLAAMVLLVCTLGGMGIGFGSAMYLMRVRWTASCPVMMTTHPGTITWLGVGIKTIADRPGPVVLHVFRGTAAERAGLAPGDVVTRFDGEPIRVADDLVSAVRSRSPGDIVELGVVRGGHPLILHARLGFK